MAERKFKAIPYERKEFLPIYQEINGKKYGFRKVAEQTQVEKETWLFFENIQTTATPNGSDSYTEMIVANDEQGNLFTKIRFAKTYLSTGLGPPLQRLQVYLTKKLSAGVLEELFFTTDYATGEYLTTWSKTTRQLIFFQTPQKLRDWLMLAAVPLGYENFVYKPIFKQINDTEKTAGYSIVKPYSWVSGELLLPNERNTWPVIQIDNQAFQQRDIKDKLVLPNNLESIGYSAFADAIGSMQSLTVPKTLKMIGQSAFSGNLIKRIDYNGTIDDWVSIKFDRPYLFQNTPLYIQNSLQNNVEINTDIGQYSFYNCSSLQKVTLKANNVGQYACYGCSSLTTFDYQPNGSQDPLDTQEIAASAFASCPKLNTWTFTKKGGSHTRISVKDRAFQNTSLTEIPCGDCIVSVGGYAFSSSKLKEADLFTSTIPTLPSYVFYNCVDLHTIKLPNSIYSISPTSWNNCTALKEIWYGGSKNDWESMVANSSYPGGSGNLNVICSDGVLTAKIDNTNTIVDYIDGGHCIYEFDQTTLEYSARGSKAWADVGAEADEFTIDIGENGPAKEYFINFTLNKGVWSETVNGQLFTPGFSTTASIDKNIHNDDLEITIYWCRYTPQQTVVLVPVAEETVTGSVDFVFKPGSTSVKVDFLKSLTGATIGNDYMGFGLTKDDAITMAKKRELLIDDERFGIPFNNAASWWVDHPVTGIYGFDGLNYLTNVIIRGTPNSIASETFINCPYLDTIKCENLSIDDWKNATNTGDGIVWNDNTKNTLYVYCKDGEFDFYGNSYFNYPFFYSDDATTLIGYKGVLGKPDYNLNLESLTCIGPSALAEKTTEWKHQAGVQKISITSKVTHIYDYAFQGLQYLKAVEIGDSLRYLGAGVFDGCDKQWLLKEEYPIDRVTLEYFSFGSDATAPKKALISYNVSWGSVFDKLNLTEYSIIASEALQNCQNNEFVFGTDLVGIGDNVFPQDEYCEIYVTYEGKTEDWEKIVLGDNWASGPRRVQVRFSDGKGVDIMNVDALRFELDEAQKNYIVFGKDEYDDLESLTIPNFYNNKPVKAIGDSAFAEWKDLTEVVLGENITTIKDYAFSDCTNLKNVYGTEQILALGVSSFSECTALASFTISDKIGTIPDYCFYNCWSLALNGVDEGTPEQISIRDECEFGTMSFYNVGHRTLYYESWKEFSIRCSRVKIHPAAFQGSAITKLETQSTVEFIMNDNGEGSYFDGCQKLSQLPKLPKVIPYRSFAGCTGLQEIYLSGEHEIRTEAFSNINNIRRICLLETNNKFITVKENAFSRETDSNSEKVHLICPTYEHFEANSFLDLEGSSYLDRRIYVFYNGEYDSKPYLEWGIDGDVSRAEYCDPYYATLPISCINRYYNSFPDDAVTEYQVYILYQGKFYDKIVADTTNLIGHQTARVTFQDSLGLNEETKTILDYDSFYAANFTIVGDANGGKDTSELLKCLSGG